MFSSSQVLPVRAPSNWLLCFLDIPHHSLRPSWCSNVIKYSHLILDFSCPSLGLEHFSKGLCFFLVENGIQSSLLLGCHCAQNFSVDKARKWMNEWWLNEWMNTRSYSYMYFYIILKVILPILIQQCRVHSSFLPDISVPLLLAERNQNIVFSVFT